MKTKKLKPIQNIKTTKGNEYNNDSNLTLSQIKVKQEVGKRKNKK